MNVDRLARHAQLYGARHAQLYGCAGIFPAAAASVKGAELVRLAAILRRRGWRPSKAEQDRIDAARVEAPPAPIREWHATFGWSLLRPHGEWVLSVAEAEPDLWVESGGNGARGACESCGRPFEAKRSTARYCGPTCRSRAHRRRVGE